eukprot:539645-Rhodomonas_salina.1
MGSAVEDHLLEMHKKVINKWREASFPSGVKDDGTAHKEPLRAILFHPEITRLLAGHVLVGINLWLKQPWRMPAVQIWWQILQKYEGISENATGNFID